jgi:hypothetical protein
MFAEMINAKKTAAHLCNFHVLNQLAKMLCELCAFFVHFVVKQKMRRFSLLIKVAKF